MTVWKKQSGFTLIELMVVTTLIALLAGAAGGLYMSSYKRRRMEKIARELLLAAKYARVLALETQQPCKLVFREGQARTQTQEETEQATPDQTGFWVAVEQYNQQTGQTQEVVIRDIFCRPVVLEEGLSFEKIEIQPLKMIEESDDVEQATEITFQPNGTANMAQVTLGDGRIRFTLLVSSSTGKAKLVEGQAEDIAAQTVDLDQ